MITCLLIDYWLMIDWWPCHSIDCVLIYWIVQLDIQILPKKLGTDCLGLAVETSDEKNRSRSNVFHFPAGHQMCNGKSAQKIRAPCLPVIRLWRWPPFDRAGCIINDWWLKYLVNYKADTGRLLKVYSCFTLHEYSAAVQGVVQCST